MIKGILFDFDGVVVDSEYIYLIALVDYLKSIGADAKKEDVSYVIGSRNIEIYNNMKKQYNLTVGFKEFENGSDNPASRLYSKENAIPGAIEFIKKCHDKGIRMCIVSSNRLFIIERQLRHYDIFDCFDFIISDEDNFRSKPNPDSYNAAIKRLGINKDEAIIIEDSTNGCKAGRASGIYTYGLKASRVSQDTSAADKEVYGFDEINI